MDASSVKTASSVPTINNTSKETFHVYCKSPAGQLLQSDKEYEFKVCLLFHVTHFFVQRHDDVLAGASDFREVRVRYL